MDDHLRSFCGTLARIHRDPFAKVVRESASILLSITKFSNEAYDPADPRSTWATGRATWLALAGSIDLVDWLSDLARPGWLDRLEPPAERPCSPWLARSTWSNGCVHAMAVNESLNAYAIDAAGCAFPGPFGKHLCPMPRN